MPHLEQLLLCGAHAEGAVGLLILVHHRFAGARRRLWGAAEFTAEVHNAYTGDPMLSEMASERMIVQTRYR